MVPDAGSEYPAISWRMHHIFRQASKGSCTIAIWLGLVLGHCATVTSSDRDCMSHCNVAGPGGVQLIQLSQAAASPAVSCEHTRSTWTPRGADNACGLRQGEEGEDVQALRARRRRAYAAHAAFTSAAGDALSALRVLCAYEAAGCSEQFCR